MKDDLLKKYITEGKGKKFVGDMRYFVKNQKTGNYSVGDGTPVKITKAAGMMIFEYPSSATSITLQLIDASDLMGYKFQQIGMRSNDNMKFIVEL